MCVRGEVAMFVCRGEVAMCVFVSVCEGGGCYVCLWG